MRIDSIFEETFSSIYGKPAWRVSPGWGSFLTLEFGDPHLEVREPVAAKGNVSERVKKERARRRVFIHGDWHLWINCCDWEVTSGGNLVGRSTAARSIQTAADFLDGPKIDAIHFEPRTDALRFRV